MPTCKTLLKHEYTPQKSYFLHRLTAFILVAVVLCLIASPQKTAFSAERKILPNIIILLADDLGYGDLGCYGHPLVKSPNLDLLAKQGIRFTNCYAAAPNCSPSRTGLMTGRTPWRVGVHNWIPFMSPVHVRDSEITIATLLQNAGYDTGHFGKWHLNGMFNLPGQPQPNDHGFKHWFSVQNNALPNHRNPYNFVRNGIPVGPLEGYSAQLVAQETIKWLDQPRDESTPFFAFVCFNEPHEPIASAPKYTSLYQDQTDLSLRAHHGNISQLDDAVGSILKKIDQMGLAESTFVMFTSDNGPAITGWHPHGSAGPLRAKKGHVYDGGIRVPGMIRWPGKVKAGVVSSEPIIGTDLLPTLCEIAAIASPQDRVLDGSSFLPALSGKPIQRKRPLYWHFYRASSQVKVAIREGNWKILATLDGPVLKGVDITREEIIAYKTANLKDFELYNLEDDIAESEELSSTHSDRFASMKKQLQQYYLEVREESPSWTEWKWPRYEGKRIKWPEYIKRKRKK